nr:reverse transcriptase domain-containing protein [Tanacetum cinerariifolium]
MLTVTPNLKEQILNQLSSLKALVKLHNEIPLGRVTPIRLSFGDEPGPDLPKGPEVEESKDKDEDLRKPHKEVLKSPLSRRLIEFSAPNHRTPTHLKIYDGSTDQDDHVTRFVGAANQGEWEMPIWFALRRRCCKEPIEATRIIRRENETLPNFKERRTQEMSFIPDVPVVMQISSFVNNSKCPELARSTSHTFHHGPITTDLMKDVKRSITSCLTATQTELVGFLGEQLLPLGKIELEVAFGTEGLNRRMTMTFTVVREASPYNVILGRTEKKKPAPEGERHQNKNGFRLKKKQCSSEECRGPKKPSRIKGGAGVVKGRHNPADFYPLPEIDLKIEAVMGFPFKCFLDAYKGYHQIQMDEEDEEKTAFYTDQGTYCYTKMTFGLNNIGATYQRVVDSAFQTQLGRNLKAYVDDMVIKSKTERDMVIDIAETFHNIWKINMKLKLKKCSFGSPKTLREMQSLNEKLAALNRFLSKSVERSLLFFETLKNITKENKDENRWTVAAENAFQELKKLIMELPTLTTPIKKEPLFIYLATSRDAVSGVLMAEQYTYAIRLTFTSTNNEAEYEALLVRLKTAHKMKIQELKAKVDSNLVTCQLNGKFVANSEGMAKYLAKAKEQVAQFKKFSIENIP